MCERERERESGCVRACLCVGVSVRNKCFSNIYIYILHSGIQKSTVLRDSQLRPLCGLLSIAKPNRT